MFRAWYRARVGMDGDVVYELKSALVRLLFIFPISWDIGWHVHCNAASARNRHIQKLNKMTRAILEELHLYAEAEAQVQADFNDLTNNKFDGFGVGVPVRLPKKEVQAMLPFTPDVKPEFKDIIHAHVVNKILLEHGIKKSQGSSKKQGTNGHNNPNRPHDMVVTTEKGKRTLDNTQDASSHVVAFKAERISKEDLEKRRNELRRSNPRREGESKGEHNNRINNLLKSK